MLTFSKDTNSHGTSSRSHSSVTTIVFFEFLVPLTRVFSIFFMTISWWPRYLTTVVVDTCRSVVGDSFFRKSPLLCQKVIVGCASNLSARRSSKSSLMIPSPRPPGFSFAKRFHIHIPHGDWYLTGKLDQNNLRRSAAHQTDAKLHEKFSS